MNLFDELSEMGHEQVIFCTDPRTGLKAIIGIHNTVLGPALGGTRMWTYDNDAAALQDVLRLSRGMTYKAAVAGLNLGGGKAVIFGDSRTEKTEALFRSYGRHIESLCGRYITAEDVGTSVQDMEWVRMETKFVTGVDGPGGSGDPSPFTAYGVFNGIKACAKKVYGNDSLSGRTIAVQGAGNVATNLIEHLTHEGATVYVSDIFEDKVKFVCTQFGARYISPDEIVSLECDIFSPNALGGILNDDSIPALRCQIVAGGANNQLADEKKHGRQLKDMGILYAPDYVVNAGGLMNVASEIDGYDREKVLVQAEGIYGVLLHIFSLSDSENIAANEASDAIAEERIASIAHIHQNFVDSVGRQS